VLRGELVIADVDAGPEMTLAENSEIRSVVRSTAERLGSSADAG
jgi:hypothetical protein